MSSITMVGPYYQYHLVQAMVALKSNVLFFFHTDALTSKTRPLAKGIIAGLAHPCARTLPPTPCPISRSGVYRIGRIAARTNNGGTA